MLSSYTIKRQLPRIVPTFFCTIRKIIENKELGHSNTLCK